MLIFWSQDSISPWSRFIQFYISAYINDTFCQIQLNFHSWFLRILLLFLSIGSYIKRHNILLNLVHTMYIKLWISKARILQPWDFQSCKLRSVYQNDDFHYLHLRFHYWLRIFALQFTPLQPMRNFKTKGSCSIGTVTIVCIESKST